jgi:signal peptidase I
VVAHLPPAALIPLARRALAVALVAALAGLFVRTFTLRLVSIPSESMAPTLVAGDQILVTRWVEPRGLPAPLAALLPVRAPAVGDILLFRSPEDRWRILVKRCVALGGERFGETWVPEGTLALVGDARTLSHDSRAFGPVERGALAGRAVLVLWSRAPGGGARSTRWLAPVR